MQELIHVGPVEPAEPAPKMKGENRPQAEARRGRKAKNAVE
jgi:hypothetical protein